MEDNYIFEDYFYEIWENTISSDIVSNEYYTKNYDLIHEITYQFFDKYHRSDFPSPLEASALLTTVFSTIQRFGLR